MAIMKSISEISPKAVILGLVSGVVICAATVYVGLMAGIAPGASIPVAIIGFGVFKGILPIFKKNGTILEINITQTSGSGVAHVAGGLIFTVPALWLLGYNDFNLVYMGIAAVIGALAGIVFIIPLRKQMIEIDALPFPGGTAVAEILKAPGEGVRKSKIMLVGFAIGTLVTLMTIGSGLDFLNRIIPLSRELPLGEWLGLPPYIPFAFAVSTALIGAGIITGGKLASITFVFCLFGSFVLAPWAVMKGIVPASDAEGIKSAFPAVQQFVLKPFGVGALIGGALMGFVFSGKAMAHGVKSILKADWKNTGEMPGKALIILAVGGLVGLSLIGIIASGDPIRGLIAGVVGMIWIFMAAVIISECSGLTNMSPISGMALIATLLMLAIFGTSRSGVYAAVMMGAAVCVAAGEASDMMHDLKTGHLVGSVPRKQQLVQIYSPVVGIPVALIILGVLAKAYGIGGDVLPAPQAGALQGIIEMVKGGAVPYFTILGGVVLGTTLSVAGISGVMAGIGIYLPMSYPFALAAGGWCRSLASKIFGEEKTKEYAIPFAAGLIAGDAITMLVNALYIISKALPGGGA
ncbi:MAG: hypothetical protein CVT48_00365 [Thermoplasmata archaeon HGW-Thermoplasmata-1]|nr:MAG: hypothetical protein CVT48_00365 [Thermoplasmata archaeon HGW-Thermoplasmata-1]